MNTSNNQPTLTPSIVHDALLGMKTSRVLAYLTEKEIAQTRAFAEDIIAFCGDSNRLPPEKVKTFLIENKIICEEPDWDMEQDPWYVLTRKGRHFFRPIAKSLWRPINGDAK